MYEKALKKRGVKSVEQHRTPTLREPSSEEIMDLHYVYRTWTLGDSFWKYATEFYGSPQYWWVIASINKVSSESAIKIGDTIAIPQDLATALQVVG